MIDVCICTHNPRLEILKKVLVSIQNQSIGAAAFRVLLVDNASSPPLEASLLRPLKQSGIAARIVSEPTLGTQHARIAAASNTDAEWILWVDDDNVLNEDYIENALSFITQHPEVGCFGGKLLLPENGPVKEWVKPFLPFLAIKDAGDAIIVAKAEYWTQAEPPGAGAFVHRRVLKRYLLHSENEMAFQLGRVSDHRLVAGEDSLMMRGAADEGLACAYVPTLSLYHYIDTDKRLRFGYLIKLMKAYGVGHVILESLLKGWQPMPDYYASRIRFRALLFQEFMKGASQSIAFGIGMAAYHVGARSQHFRQRQNR